ncbi:MAG TPA: DUF3037 domain-containing protein [Alicycliphilus sp.]|nr:DUF3037 domain-containing protein [Alicycliphilus sp.]
MSLVACRYAVVQFAPYRETGEFANAGVVLLCPTTGYFGYKLQTQRARRITDFFDELPREIYMRAIKAMGEELQRVAQVVANIPPGHGRSDALRHIFDSLTHPREAMVRFGTPRAVMTADPAAELERQFGHCVERSFVTPEYVERTMEKRIKQLLNTLPLAAPFGPQRVGDDAFHANFSLVQQQGDVLTKIIKPLRLNQDAPVEIYEHGDAWLQKIKRLRVRNLLPEAVLVAVKPPEPTDTKRHAAYLDICTDLQKLEVQTVPDNAERLIADFALH